MTGLAFDAPGTWPPATLPDAFIAPQPVETLRWASAGYATRATESPASTLYEPRITSDVVLRLDATAAVAGSGGVLGLASGDVPVWDADEALENLDRFGLADARAIRIRALPVANRQASDFGQPYTAATLAYSGLVRGVYRTVGRQGRIAVADQLDRLDLPLQPTRYGGTGSTEGGSDLKGRPKPVTLGRVYNMAGVYLGNLDLGAGTLPTYQVHWRTIQSVDAVRIRGVDQAVVTSGIPTVGQARAWPGLGMFQLGSTPDGDVTADIRGDAAGGYVSTTAGILRRLLTSLSPAFADGDLDPMAWAFADNDLPGEVGWTSQGQDMTAAAACQAIVAGCGAVLCGGRAGTVRLFSPIARDNPQFTLDLPRILDLAPVDLPASMRPLPIAAAVRWRPNWSPVSNPAGATPTADRERLQRAFSGPERVIAGATINRVALQRDLTLPGLYWSQADAATVAGLWRDWLDAGPRLFRVMTDRYRGQIDAGSIGRVTYPAYGLQNGVLGVVLGWEEALGAGRLAVTIATIPEV